VVAAREESNDEMIERGVSDRLCMYVRVHACVRAVPAECAEEKGERRGGSAAGGKEREREREIGTDEARHASQRAGKRGRRRVYDIGSVRRLGVHRSRQECND